MKQSHINGWNLPDVRPMSLWLLLSIPTMSTAADGEFADDFSVDSTRYSSFSFDGSGGTSTAEGVAGGIRMSVASEGSEYANEFLRVGGSSDTLHMMVSFDTESLSFTDLTAYADFRVEGVIYNDTADGGVGEGDSSEGDVFLSMNIGLDGFGNSYSGVCLSRSTESGGQELNLFDGGSSSCANFDSISVAAGESYDIGYTLDREGESLRLHVNEQELLVDLPGPVFRQSSPYMGANFEQGNGAASVAMLISSITTDSGIDNFSDGIPVVGRYDPFYQVNGIDRTAEVIDGALRMMVTSEEDSGYGISLQPAVPTSYIEAMLSIEPESDFSASSMQSAARIQAILYNDIADGGTGSRQGDVRAELDLVLAGDGMRRSEYCLRRFDDQDGEFNTGLLENERTCVEMPVLVEAGRSYRTAIALDRENATVTFRVDGQSVVVPVSTDMFLPAEAYMQVTAESRNGAQTLVTIDDVRTSPTALTAGEQAAGESEPEAFPAPVELPTANSTIESVFDADQAVTFLDDFSADTALLAFDAYPDSAEAGIQYIDGAVELQAHSTDEFDSGSAALNINAETDFIRADVSLSSKTDLPLGESEASLDMEAVFYNDTMDGGLDNREGDIESKIRIRVYGNGRQVISAEMRRRNADGGTDGLNLFDGEDTFYFEDISLAFDTVYELGIQLDRERGVMIFQVDDATREVSLPTNAFEPAQRGLQLRAWHRASSGKSVISIHSVETDGTSLDFSEQAPVIAPYRPTWEAQRLGRSVTVEGERLVLRADSRVLEGNDPRLHVLGNTDYMGASIGLSSESFISDGDGVLVDISGILYNDLSETPEGTQGAVFVALRLVANGDGERYVETCAFRSNDADFGSVSQLIGNDDSTCPRMSIAPELDTAYSASVQLDREASTLTFRFAEEEFVYDIPTQIFEFTDRTVGVRARASDGSAVVAFVDDLRFSEDGEPIALSDEQLTGGGGSTGGSSGSGSIDFGLLLVLMSFCGWLFPSRAGRNIATEK